VGTGSGPIGAEGFPPRDALTRPNVARIYDAWLGGKDNFRADREVAARVAEAAPHVVAGVRANRAFLRRVVAFLAEAGLSQLIDLGSGLPTADNVHEVAGRVNPEAKVVYVDNDPIVLVHARALLADRSRSIVVEGDIRQPEQLLADAQLQAHINFQQPVAVLCVAILHFITDEEGPRRIVRTFRDVMAPGSYLAVSHVTQGQDDEQDAATRAGAQIYAETTAPLAVRTHAQIAQLFEGFDLIQPGLVGADEWRRRGNGRATPPILAGVGILPAEPQ
jgi:hypothetical protein